MLSHVRPGKFVIPLPFGLWLMVIIWKVFISYHSGVPLFDAENQQLMFQPIMTSPPPYFNFSCLVK